MSTKKRRKISIVVPIYDEAAILRTLYARLKKAAAKQPYDFDFLFVNDGSTDDTALILFELSRSDPRVVVLDLARNFGQHSALTAGIDYAEGDAVILMDADLEDSPEHIGRLIDAWEKGWEVVYAIRGERQGGWFRKILFYGYHTLNRYLEYHLPTAGTFSLIDRKIVDILRMLKEHNRYIPGLRTWAGFKQKGLRLNRGRRYDNRPRVSLLRLLRLTLNSYVSFSKFPLKMASLMGILLSLVGFGAIVFVVVFHLTLGFKVSGWASLIVTIIFTSGVQLICLGILGEYVGQIMDETKDRPNYLLRARLRGGKALAPLERSRKYGNR